jgi:hypothetical protein
MRCNIWYLSGLLIACSTNLQAFNRSLFFRTSAFWDEPRFERAWLSTAEAQLIGGSSYQGRDGCGKKTNILGIYGPENVQALSAAAGIPLDLPGNPRSISFQAVADVFEFDLNLYQNLCRGFFLHFHFPAILIQLSPSGYKETFCRRKECKTCKPKKFTPHWQSAQETIKSFLKHANLTIGPRRQTAASDSTLFIGWTHSNEKTCWLDFVDMTLKTGVLFPTGKAKNPNQVFDIPFGYNGHWAIPFSGDMSCGLFDWLTIGMHADTLFFFKKKQCLRMKGEHEVPSGFITLGLGEADVHPGTVWRTGVYIKADHFYNGLSFILAGTYEQQNRTQINPCDQQRFSQDHVQSDPRYLSWARSIIHLLAEYDFACETSTFGPRVALFYNRELTGERVFSIHTLGSYLGVDINWCF